MLKMLKKMEKYIEKRGLERNFEKSKLMRCRKGGGREKAEQMEQNGKEIEFVKIFNYLGYKIEKNGKDKIHIISTEGKARSRIGKIWIIGEKLFKENQKLRMRLFDAVIKSTVMYIAEMWEWKRCEELERMQLKYIKWVLRLKITTPEHIIRWEIGRKRFVEESIKRAIRYEKKARSWDDGSRIKETWRELETEDDSIRLDNNEKKDKRRENLEKFKCFREKRSGDYRVRRKRRRMERKIKRIEICKGKNN